MKKKSLLFSLSFALATAATAQDIHFSQFYMAPLNLNPAMTGVMNCNQRINLNYRNQWSSVVRSNAFQTYQVAYDHKIPVGRYDFIGLGGTVWGDQAGSLSMSQNQVNLDFSYAKKMGGYRKKANYLAMGVEASLGYRGLDIAAARWGNQNNVGTYDPTRPSGEDANVLNRSNFYFPDVSAGLLWYSVFDDNQNFYIGGAYDHINRANVSYGTTKFEPLRSKFTIHTGGEFPIASRISLLPGLVTFLQGKYLQVNGGTSLKFTLGSSKRSQESLQFGLWTRLGSKQSGGIMSDAIILSTRFDYNNINLGFSYDLNTSALKAASRGNGAFEFSLQYKVCGRERRGVYCPNF